MVVSVALKLENLFVPIVSAPGIVTDVSLQPENALGKSVSTELRVTCVIPVFWNAFNPMDVNLDISRLFCVIFVQLLKALSPTVFTLGIVTVLRSVHPVKALAPMDVAPFATTSVSVDLKAVNAGIAVIPGIVIDVNLHPPNALGHDVIPLPRTTFVIPVY
jgi:hypothetical protein